MNHSKNHSGRLPAAGGIFLSFQTPSTDENSEIWMDFQRFGVLNSQNFGLRRISSGKTCIFSIPKKPWKKPRIFQHPRKNLEKNLEFFRTKNLENPEKKVWQSSAQRSGVQLRLLRHQPLVYLPELAPFEIFKTCKGRWLSFENSLGTWTLHTIENQHCDCK